MIYQILRIAVDLSRQMLFLETYYQSLEQQREYYHVNKNVDPASRGHKRPSLAKSERAEKWS